jgi:hypothetical protein
MDKTMANKSAWDMLEREHPHKFFQGFVSYGLYLFAKDVFAATNAKRGRDV